MQRLVIGLAAVLAISACSKDSKKGEAGAPPTPDRKAEHDQAQCPTGIVGKYVQQGDASNVFEIVIQNGFLVVKDPESGDIVVNGVPAKDNGNGSNTTVICKSGNIELQSKNTDGSESLATISKTATGIKSEFRDSSGVNVVNFVRMGNPDSPTETELKLETPKENPLGEVSTEVEVPEELTITPVQSEESAERECPGASFSYQYKQTRNGIGCDTGTRTFCSIQEYCAALKVETCKKEQAQKDYQATCRLLE